MNCRPLPVHCCAAHKLSARTRPADRHWRRPTPRACRTPLAGRLQREQLSGKSASYGTRFRAVDGADYAREDPALLKAPAGVIHWTDSWSCASPGALTEGYAALFARRGGRILTGDAASLQQAGSGWQVETADGAVVAEQAVIALGPWSPRVLSRFGYRIPMIYKRGYHGHFAAPRSPLRPFLDVANGIVAAPMTGGLRLATGAALVTRQSAPDPRQLDRGREGISDLIEVGERIREPQWSGARPCLPDMLPMVGPAPRHAGLPKKE